MLRMNLFKFSKIQAPSLRVTIIRTLSVQHEEAHKNVILFFPQIFVLTNFFYSRINLNQNGMMLYHIQKFQDRQH